MELQKYYIGVDVSKETLDFALVYQGKVITHTSISNNKKEINKLTNQWKKEFNYKDEQSVVCMEHTGVYSYILLDFLQTTSSKIYLESAYNIKHSQGLQRGKNDKIDSQRIAFYAWKNRDILQEWKAPKDVIKRLKQLLSIRKGLINAKKKIQSSVNETSKFIDRKMANELKKSCLKSIKALEIDIKALEDKLMAIIESDQELLQMFRILVSIDGLGKMTAIMFLITTNAFTHFRDGKKFACYAGVVPFEHTSGKSIRGKNKVSNFANKEMKTALHLCALTLIRNKGELGEYYRRKVMEGKNKMSVLNALRNKIVLRAFACIKANKIYEKNNLKLVV